MKLRITESQLERLQNSLNETSSDNKYSKDVKVRFYHKGLFNGYEISEIQANPIKLVYSIDMEIKTWGIKSVSLFGLNGPTEIPIHIFYYINDDKEDSQIINLGLDWSKLEITEEKGSGVVTVGDELEISIVASENGFVVASIGATVYSV
jgi:hypothetical protein